MMAWMITHKRRSLAVLRGSASSTHLPELWEQLAYHPLLGDGHDPSTTPTCCVRSTAAMRGHSFDMA